MKVIIFLLFTSVNLFAQNSRLLNQNDIDIACRTLMFLTNNAIDTDNTANITLFKNTFDAINAQYPINKEVVDYFAAVKSSYSTDILPWVFSLDKIPTNQLNPSVFVNYEKDELLLKLFEDNMKLQDELNKSINVNNSITP
ncbi:hypothetical protein [Saccharicrinis aurantiacus]|uniref:hypothetical protein n=1 Tax=Saccharicrinis aurantiacus TaxID=1849719 RepID=UPI0009500DFE|nr:hypothetical protein [Saccharicrinis aurantiacus]